MDDREDLQLFFKEILNSIKDISNDNLWSRLQLDEESIALVEIMDNLEYLTESLKKPIPLPEESARDEALRNIQQETMRNLTY